jgi:hypothetical protein
MKVFKRKVKMKHRFIHILILPVLFGLALLSCDSRDEQMELDSNLINFESPKVDQLNYYLIYEGTCQELAPTGDTLMVRVARYDGVELQLTETFTPGSTCWIPSPVLYGLTRKAGNLIIPENIRQLSLLFGTYDTDTFALVKPSAVDLTQTFCKIYKEGVVFVGDEIGSIPRFEIRDMAYEDKRLISIEPDSLFQDAYIIYDESNIYSVYQSARQTIPNPTVKAYALIEF